MDTKELLKKYWFVGLIAIVLIAFIGFYSYEAYKNRDVVVKNKQVDGKYVAYTVDGEPVYADDLYNSLYTSSGLSQAVVAYERAIFDAGYETTNEMRETASNSASSILSYYSQDYLDNAMKQMGYVNGVDDLVDYYIDSQKQEMLIKEYALAHQDEYFKDLKENNSRLIYHILVKTEVKPILDENENIIGYEADATDEQKEKLNTILEELAKEDASFEYVAYQYSEDTGSATNGGYIGLISEANKDRYDQFFAETALSLKDGETSEPIVSQFGYHIIKNVGSDIDTLLNDFYYINDLANSDPTLTIKAIVDKANQLGFEIKDENLKAQIDAQLESAGQ